MQLTDQQAIDTVAQVLDQIAVTGPQRRALDACLNHIRLRLAPPKPPAGTETEAPCAE